MLGKAAHIFSIMFVLYFYQKIFHTLALIMLSRFIVPLYALLWELIKHCIILHEIRFFIMANKHIYSTEKVFQFFRDVLMASYTGPVCHQQHLAFTLQCSRHIVWVWAQSL